MLTEGRCPKTNQEMLYFANGPRGWEVHYWREMMRKSFEDILTILNHGELQSTRCAGPAAILWDSGGEGFGVDKL